MFRCCGADPKSTVVEQQKVDPKTTKAASGTNPSYVKPSNLSPPIINSTVLPVPVVSSNTKSSSSSATSIATPDTTNNPVPVARSSVVTSTVPPANINKTVLVAPSSVATLVVPSVSVNKSPPAIKSTSSTSPAIVPKAVSVQVPTTSNPEEELDEEMSAEIFTILKDIQERLSNIESGMGRTSNSPPPPKSDASEIPRGIKAFDEYSRNFLDPFVEACKKLGGDAMTGGNLLKEAWIELRSFLQMASVCKEPPSAGLPLLLGNLSAKIKAVTNAVQRNDWEKHMKTLNEGVQSLNWVIVKPAPCEFISSYSEGAEYWANNIRKEYRTSNPDQMEFCNTFKTLMLELIKYVKEHHLTGVTWNPRGIDVSAYNGDKAATASPTAASATVVSSTASAAKPAGPDLFAALNKGGNITSGLKTVTKDQQTWRAEYKGDSAPVTPAGKVAARNAPVAANSVKGPPKLEFQNAGSKWLVENQTDKSGVVVVTITEMKETVYIYGCAEATIDIKGKCKSIVVDGCKKTKASLILFIHSTYLIIIHLFSAISFG